MNSGNARFLRNFNIPGTLREFSPYQQGNINDTWLSVWEQGKKTIRYIHQKINTEVFKDVPGMMRNVERVCTLLSSSWNEQSSGTTDVTLTLVPTRRGESWLRAEDGSCWRTYVFIEHMRSYQSCPDANTAYEAGCMTGRFQQALRALSPADLIEPIPDFQKLPLRFAALRQAVKKDATGRLAEVKAEAEYAFAEEPVASQIEAGLAAGGLPLRVTHGDLRINNFLFHCTTGRACAIVDFDTCMPGSILYDFGDLARSFSVDAHEDEKDLNRVEVNLEFFRALAAGYLEEFGALLESEEKRLLVTAPRMLALTLGTRFLTDYLNGDTYFKILYPGHNLDRARAQFQVARRFAVHAEEMRRIFD